MRRDRSRRCDDVRETLSATLDGEPSPLRPTEVEDHLTGCEACAHVAATMPVVTRAARVTTARAVPDLTGEILTAVATSAHGPDQDRVRQLRLLVAFAGLVQLALAVPTLLGAAVGPVHMGRDLGSLQLALGIGFLVAAWQPRRATGLLPVAAVVGAAAIITGLIDVLTGVASATAELAHLSEVVGVGALWLLTRTSRQAAADHEPIFRIRTAAVR